jgi:rhamnopyranosyl-N-acetylglucosaminyl-diphospho-decaprenol beta-1,3/1,4-galactofuranosyltransferase
MSVAGGPEHVPGTVLGVVLTHDSRELLRRCLSALDAQTEPLDALLVVDNASNEDVADLAAGSGAGRVLRLPENLGPAGGYAAGLEAFLASDADWAWLLDDDCIPTPTALAALRRAAGGTRAPRVLLATTIDHESREVVVSYGWWGVLIPRVVVEAVGVPIADLFYWVEDTEYLQWRIPRAGFPVERCVESIVEVQHSRPAGAAKPAWKYYYEARNQLYFRWRVQLPNPRATDPKARRRARRKRAREGARAVSKLALKAAFREHDQRWHKLAMVGRGACDGARGRLGRTVPVDESDRPHEADKGGTSS